MKIKRDYHLWTLTLVAIGLFGAFVGQSILTPAQSTNATGDSANLEVAATIKPTIAITTEGADEFGNLEIEPDASADNMGTGTITVKVSTNDPTGYSLYITTDTADNTLSQDGITERVRALTGETAVADFPENYWGYSIDGGDTYYPVQPNTENPAVYPDKLPTAQSAMTYDSTANNHETEVTIGARISASLPSGTYGNAVVFTAITNASISGN